MNVPPDGDPRAESTQQRNDRNLAELLQELRVAGLGIQILFAFLLALPLSSRFVALHPWQRGLYTAILVVSAAATALLLGPVAYHRLVFRRRQKEYLISAANLMAISGLAAVALAVSGTVLLVVSYVYSGPAGLAVGGCAPSLFGGLWFAFPLIRRERAGRDQ